jgi:hypothetical protein
LCTAKNIYSNEGRDILTLFIHKGYEDLLFEEEVDEEEESLLLISNNKDLSQTTPQSLIRSEE